MKLLHVHTVGENPDTAHVMLGGRLISGQSTYPAGRKILERNEGKRSSTVGSGYWQMQSEIMFHTTWGAFDLLTMLVFI